MIFDTIFNAVYGLITTVVGFFPTGTLPTDLLGPSGGLVHGYYWLDTFLPLHEALAIFAALAVVWFAAILFRAFITVWDMIPLKFT